MQHFCHIYIMYNFVYLYHVSNDGMVQAVTFGMSENHRTPQDTTGHRRTHHRTPQDTPQDTTGYTTGHPTAKTKSEFVYAPNQGLLRA